VIRINYIHFSLKTGNEEFGSSTLKTRESKQTANENKVNRYYTGKADARKESKLGNKYHIVNDIDASNILYCNL
jgi:hypothetical protein